MSIYEKLVYLAGEPFNQQSSLSSQLDKKIDSHRSVLNMLQYEFDSNSYAHNAIDMRQACETKVVGV